MTEFKGTPGPWRYRPDQTGAVFADKELLASVYPNCPDDETENVRGEWTGIHEMRANARLISAAPELLEALVRWSNAMWQAGVSPVKDSHDPMEAMLFDTRAAIAKALGEGQ